MNVFVNALQILWSHILDVLFPFSPDEKHIATLPSTYFLIHASYQAQDSVLETCNATAICQYNNQHVRTLIHLLKYKRRKELARTCAELLADACFALITDEHIMHPKHSLMLIPLPLSSSHRRSRGFNQTELIAEKLIQLFPDTCTLRTDILYKKDIPSQTTMPNKKARIENVCGAFFVAPETDLAHTTCILIDDVITTGATMNDARRALTEAGAHCVHGLAIAH